jgi:hypothetical protein
VISRFIAQQATRGKIRALTFEKSNKDCSIFHCIHHSADTRNDRELEPRVLRDEEGIL